MGQKIDHGDEDKPGREGEQALQGQPPNLEVQSEIDTEHGSQGSTRGNADHERPGHRVLEIALKDGSGERKAGSDQEGQKNPGESEVDKNDRIGLIVMKSEIPEVFRGGGNWPFQERKQKPTDEEKEKDDEKKTAAGFAVHGFCRNCCGWSRWASSSRASMSLGPGRVAKLSSKK